MIHAFFHYSHQDTLIALPQLCARAINNQFFPTCRWKMAKTLPEENPWSFNLMAHCCFDKGCPKDVSDQAYEWQQGCR